MLLWKNQNPWTSLRGQLYDVFLDQNGGFYGYQHGAEPLHIQLNLNDSSVCVVNQTLFDENDLTVSAELFDIHGKNISTDSYKASVSANKYVVLKKINTQNIKEEVYFLRLKLLDKSNNLKDENFYWLAKPGKSYVKLNELKQVDLQCEFKPNTKGEKIALIKNPGNETAFFIRLKMIDAASRELALPVFFGENYFTLLPGESREIKVDDSFLVENDKTESFLLETEGWNIMKKTFKIE
jgi:hypothetical protein